MACHGADGRGAPVRAAMREIPDFTNRKWQSSRSDAELRHSILEGKGKFMLPMKSKVGTLGAEGLEAYVRDFAHGTEVEQPAPKPVPKPAHAKWSTRRHSPRAVASTTPREADAARRRARDQWRVPAQ